MRDTSPATPSCPAAPGPLPAQVPRRDWPLACARARRDLARRIHDSLGPLIAAAGMTVTRLDRPTVTEADRAAHYTRLGSLVADLATAMRSIEASLHPALLDQAGLDAALQARLAQLCDGPDGVKWTTHVDAALDAGDADPLLTYRLAESLVAAYLAAMRPRAFALTVQAAAAATRIELTLTGGSPRQGAACELDAADDAFSFLSLTDWLAAARATLHEASAPSGQHVVTVTVPEAA